MCLPVSPGLASSQCGGLWMSMWWAVGHIVFPPCLEDSGSQSSCLRPLPWLFASEPRLEGPWEAGGRIGDPCRGSKRSKNVRAKGQGWYQPCHVNNKMNNRWQESCTSHARHCAKRFMWANSCLGWGLNI